MSNTPRRIIPKINNISVLPSTEGMISDALSVIQTEIVKFASKTKKGQSLDLSEARVLQGYIKCLVDLSREHRERDKETDLSNLSDEDLATMVKGLLKDANKVG